MVELAIGQAEGELEKLVDRAIRNEERVLLTRDGRPVAAIVPIEEVELLERLEDEYDILMVERAIEEDRGQPSIPWEEVKARLATLND